MDIELNGRKIRKERAVQLAILSESGSRIHLYRYEEEGYPPLFYIEIEGNIQAVNINTKTGTDQTYIPQGIPTSIIREVSKDEAGSIYLQAQRKIGIWADISS